MRRTRALGYRTIVVPLLGDDESERALAVACRLAAEHRARLLLLAPLVVEPELPLDAHFLEEEQRLHARLQREQALAESYGLTAKTSIARVRPGELGRAVAVAADEQRATLVVIGAQRPAAQASRLTLRPDVASVLRDAHCRVLVLTGAPRRAAGRRAA